ncbi:probable 4-coumarate--CoA ligase 3 [Culex pipiens pallens]|uniref:probable 4-coumarate--CoA ligase 3 n=1 Tax=Culex pipiens pallens TaxID=42434 RepID=UPI0019533592|nr:probable 4-coumarate--CoA ligase 3 [Culex pipiens pallens]
MNPTYDRETKVWSGPHQPPILNPEASFGQTLFAMMGLNPDKVIQIDVDTGRSMTCGEMRLRAIRAAQNLMALRLGQGDMVSMACANSENLVPMALGLLINGMPFNPLAPGYGLDDMAHMMEITQPKLVFCDANNYELTMKAVELSVKIKPLIYVFESDMENVNKAEDLLKETGREQLFLPPYLGDSRKQLGIVMCSSGTTGLPKGVCLNHAQLIAISATLLGFKFECMLNFSPIYWSSGLFTMLTSLLACSTRLVTRSPFNADLCFDLLEKYPVDLIYTPPSYANMLIVHPRLKSVNWTHMKVWVFGGSFLSPKVRDSIAAKLPNGVTTNYYGNSEIGGFAGDLVKQKPHSVGTLLTNIKAKVVDDDGEVLSNGEQGELLVKFCEDFSGYYNNSKASAESVDADGWFRTGDIAYFDEEGFLFLVDRKKDLLKYRNYQIAPADLEGLIGKIDGVAQVCVVGLPDEDESSDKVTAVVVKADGSNLTEEKLLEIVHGTVADYKKLRGGVYFVSEIPLTSTGKPLRRKLRNDLIERLKM